MVPRARHKGGKDMAGYTGCPHWDDDGCRVDGLIPVEGKRSAEGKGLPQPGQFTVTAFIPVEVHIDPATCRLPDYEGLEVMLSRTVRSAMNTLMEAWQRRLPPGVGLGDWDLKVPFYHDISNGGGT